MVPGYSKAVKLLGVVGIESLKKGSREGLHAWP